MPPKKKASIRGRPKSANPRSKFVHIKCTPQWHEWVSAEAKKRGLTLSEFAAKGIEFYVAYTGPEAAPKR